MTLRPAVCAGFSRWRRSSGPLGPRLRGDERVRFSAAACPHPTGLLGIIGLWVPAFRLRSPSFGGQVAPNPPSALFHSLSGYRCCVMHRAVRARSTAPTPSRAARAAGLRRCPRRARDRSSHSRESAGCGSSRFPASAARGEQAQDPLSKADSAPRRRSRIDARRPSVPADLPHSPQRRGLA